METRELKIIVTEKATKDGRKFNTYKTFSKNGRPTEVKFRKDVTEVPKKSGFYTFDEDALNLNTTGEYPVLWVRANPVSFREIGEASKESEEKQRAAIKDYFG